MANLHRGRTPRAKNMRLNMMLSEVEYKNCQTAAEIMDCSMAEVMRDGLKKTVKYLKKKGDWPEEGKDNVD